MTPDEFTKGLAKMAVDAKRFTDKLAPRVAGKTAADFFTKNFTARQGFLDAVLAPWEDVQRRTSPRRTPRGKTAAGRKILFGETRNLSRSIGYEAQGDGVAVVYSDVEYAPYHNEGTDDLPQRQFMGDSAELDKLILSELERKLGKIIPN